MVDLMLAGRKDVARRESAGATAGATAASPGIAALPALSLTDLSGRPLTAADLAGRVVLVEFWATWCPPCRSTLDWLAGLERAHRERIATVALAVESPESEVRSTGASIGPGLSAAVADEATARAFGDITSVPTLFVFDRQGRTAGVTYGAPPDLHEQVGRTLDPLLTRAEASPAAGASAAAAAESAPTPYTAEQIRGSNPAGRLIRFRVEEGDQVAVTQTRFLAANAEGADVEVSTLDEQGAVLESRTSHVTWAELQGHARFPKSATRISDETVTTSLGTFDASVYDVADPTGNEMHFVFARGRPGPPIKYWSTVDGCTVMSAEMVAFEMQPEVPAAAAKVLPAAAVSAAAAGPGADAPFDWIKGLAGEWEGTFEWSGGRTGKVDLRVRYRLTGNGTAVVEDLIMGDEPSMTSVYHLDGADLRMTHYCGAGNQPRLKATAIDTGKRSIHFDLVDVTNLKGPTAGHVTGVDLLLSQPDRLELAFTFQGSGVASYERIQATRRGAR